MPNPQPQEEPKNRLVELLVDLCLYGDVAETPWPAQLLHPTWDKLTQEQQQKWLKSLDDEQHLRTEIAASILALVYGGRGGTILSADRDQELGKLLREAGSQAPSIS